MTDQPRERHLRRDTGFRQTTPPPNTRPYRRASATGNEMRTHTLDREQRWAQIGWHGQTGAFYALDEKPSHHEPGSISPLWILVDNDPPTIGTAPEDECASS